MRSDDIGEYGSTSRENYKKVPIDLGPSKSQKPNSQTQGFHSILKSSSKAINSTDNVLASHEDAVNNYSKEHDEEAVKLSPPGQSSKKLSGQSASPTYVEEQQAERNGLAKVITNFESASRSSSDKNKFISSTSPARPSSSVNVYSSYNPYAPLQHFIAKPSPEFHLFTFPLVGQPVGSRFTTDP